MKKIYAFIIAALLTVSVSLPQQANAQSPQKMSYQAIIRNSSNTLLTNTQIRMEINIRQGSVSGTVVYTETQTPTTNANGLVSIEIGGGAGFNAINWAAGPYFLETNTDPTGGTNYSISGTSQLLSVPYALHAKTAESLTGSITETDPQWTASPSSGITSTNISNWNTAYGWGNHASAGYLTTETDGVIGNEITAATNATLTRSGAGTGASPYSIALNLNNVNAWTGEQTFNANTSFPGSGIWNTAGNVGIGTQTPGAKLEVNGQLKITGGTPGAGKVLTSDATGLATWQAVSGGSSSRAVTSSSDYTVRVGDNVLISNATTSITYTLPDASLAGSGAVLYFYGIIQAFDITSSQTIYDLNGAAKTTLSGNFSVTLASDGVNKWFQMR